MPPPVVSKVGAAGKTALVGGCLQHRQQMEVQAGVGQASLLTPDWPATSSLSPGPARASSLAPSWPSQRPGRRERRPESSRDSVGGRRIMGCFRKRAVRAWKTKQALNWGDKCSQGICYCHRSQTGWFGNFSCSFLTVGKDWFGHKEKTK